MKDFCPGIHERSRDDAKNAERITRYQLSKFLLRNERVDSDRALTVAHAQWLKQQTIRNVIGLSISIPSRYCPFVKKNDIVSNTYYDTPFGNGDRRA